MSGNCTRSRTGYVCCRRNSLALKRSAVGECAAGGCSAFGRGKGAEVGIPVGMQEAYEEEIVRINVAALT